MGERGKPTRADLHAKFAPVEREPVQLVERQLGIIRGEIARLTGIAAGLELALEIVRDTDTHSTGGR